MPGLLLIENVGYVTPAASLSLGGSPPLQGGDYCPPYEGGQTRAARQGVGCNGI